MDPTLILWQQFIEGRLTNGSLRAVILESWQRARAAGVDPQAEHPIARRVGDDDLRRRQEANADLRAAATPHVEWATTALAPIPHAAYVTDPDGIVVVAAGNRSDLEAFGLMPGCDRSEGSLGTNAAGTALAVNQPLVVSGAEHFCRPFHDLLDAAAPLPAPDGTVRGAVGLCTRRADGSAERRALVAHLAYAIGRELSRRQPWCPAETPSPPPESPEQQQALSEAFADFTCEARFDGKEVVVESVSEGFTRVTGYTRDEINAQGRIPLVLHPDDLLIALEGLSRLMAGETATSEIRMITKAGEVRWLRCLARPLRETAASGVLRIRGVAQDITERKQAGQRLQESEQRFRQLAENIQEVFWMSDPLKTQILYCSPAYEKVWGRSCASLFQQPWSWWEAVHSDDRGRYAGTLEQLGRGQPTDVEYRIVRPDGSIRWVRDRGFPIRDPAGQVYRVAGVADDITERKRAEEHRQRLEDQLRRQNDVLAAADRRKDEFLAMLAHELRNPLAPIRNALHILKQPAANGALLGQVREIAERQVGHMARLLDDLLDVSRISRGRIELRTEVVEVSALVERTVEAVRPLIEDRGHHLTVSLPPQALRVRGDPTRLEQVLTNLLNNAAKYTDPGGHISLTAARDGAAVELRVQDNGVGIPPDVLLRVFDLFVQAERRLDRSQGGVGIGLTLVKKLAELHGGTVAAFSPGPGQGSEFVVRLPALPAERDVPERQPGPGTAEAPKAGPRRILVVDDNVDAADSLALFLKLTGAEVRVAYDGPTALVLAQGLRPQVVLLDVGMPGMDGHEVARRLRQQPGLEGTVMVAVTGWAQEEDRRHSRQAGFDYHLVKPVEPDALHQLLAQLP